MHGAGDALGDGLEPVEVGGKSVTATHYSLVSGGVRAMILAGSRRAGCSACEIPSQQLVAAREELPTIVCYSVEVEQRGRFRTRSLAEFGNPTSASL